MVASYTFPKDTYVLIGKITRAHGIRGEVKIYIFPETRATLDNIDSVALVSENGDVSPRLKVKKWRAKDKFIIGLLDTVSDRNKAEELVGCGVLLFKEDIEQTSPEDLPLILEDLTVETESGEIIGKIVSTFSNGAHDIMVIRQGEREYMIPLIEDIMVSHTHEKLIINPMPGLLEIYQE